MGKSTRCDVAGCSKRGRFPVDGTPFTVCGPHHPMIGKKAPSHLEVVAAFQASQRQLAALSAPPRAPEPGPSELAPRLPVRGASGRFERADAGSALSWILLALVLLGVVAVLLAVNAAFLQHWLAIHTGTLNESGPYYGFWSGFGSDLGEVTLVTAVCVGVYHGIRQANCHQPGCWRIGRLPEEGTPHKFCPRHHPDVQGTKVTAEGILRRRAVARARREASPKAPKPGK